MIPPVMKRSPIVLGAQGLVAVAAVVWVALWIGGERGREAQEGAWLAGGKGSVRLGVVSAVGEEPFTKALPTKTDRERELARGRLDDGEMDALVRGAVLSKETPESEAIFERLLDEVRRPGLGKEQAVAARARMLQLGASAKQLRQFDYVWAAFHPEASIAYLEEIPEEQRRQFTKNMLAGLASENPQAAIKLFHSLEEELRDEIRPSLLEGLVDNDPRVATEYIFEAQEETAPEDRSWRSMDQLAREMEREQGVQATLDWADSLPEGSLRGNAWSAAYAVWGIKDPLAALNSINALAEGGDRNQAINGFISAHVQEDAERALQWAGQITSPPMREAALIRAGRQYYVQDPEAASQWFASSGLREEAWVEVTGGK